MDLLNEKNILNTFFSLFSNIKIRTVDGVDIFNLRANKKDCNWLQTAEETDVLNRITSTDS